MLRLGRSALFAEVTKQRLQSPRTGRVLMSSAFQTKTPRNAMDTHALHAQKLRNASLGVAVMSAAAISMGLDLDLHQSPIAESRAAIISDHRKPRWQLFDQIGSGAFGTVRLGMHEDSGEVAAVKIVVPDQRNYSALEREISALKLVKALGGHRNIIDLRDVYVEGRKVCLVTELARGGELFEHIVAYGSFNEDRARALAQDIAGALSFLHRHGLVHKDVKPENILMSSQDQNNNVQGFSVVKLADFGSAGPANTNAITTTKATNSVNKLEDIGTSAYLPPELLESGICTTAWDMWALGCVLYISLCGSHPFDLDGTASDAMVEQRIKTEPITFDFAAWTSISPEAKDLISKLLQKDPALRPTADQVLLHPWVLARQQPQIPTAAAISQLVEQTIHT